MLQETIIYYHNNLVRYVCLLSNTNSLYAWWNGCLANSQLVFNRYQLRSVCFLFCVKDEKVDSHRSVVETGKRMLTAYRLCYSNKKNLLTIENFVSHSLGNPALKFLEEKLNWALKY